MQIARCAGKEDGRREEARGREEGVVFEGVARVSPVGVYTGFEPDGAGGGVGEGGPGAG